ncbi:MAG: hypothetical protein ACYCZA_14025 [Thiobacillus sp.]
MAIGTKPPIKTVSAKRAKSTTVAARKRSVSAKLTPRPKASKAAAKPVRRRVPAAAKATTTAARKTVARPPVVKKLTPVKKVAHQPEPSIAKGNKKGKLAKVKKAKLVRDSFTMPDVEYALIATLKKRCLNVGLSAKKSEILRAAVANLAKLSDASVVASVRRLEVIKTGRPAKGSK